MSLLSRHIRIVLLKFGLEKLKIKTQKEEQKKNNAECFIFLNFHIPISLPSLSLMNSVSFGNVKD